MFSSIREKILFWMTLLLSLGVAVFGSTLYFRVRQAMLNEVDADLLGAAQSVAVALPKTLPQELAIPEPYRHRFGLGPRDRPWLVVWDASGQVLTTSGNAPPDVQPEPEPPPQKGRHPFRSVDRGLQREVIISTPDGGQLLVGRSVHREWDRLSALRRWILLTGSGVLIIGLSGGWIISGRILAPVEKMTQAAESISASNLSQRIDLAGIDNELGRLASVLNGMFERLESAFERQTRFTADASHELRTPVAVILSQTEMALSRERSTAVYREALAACCRSARRMKLLIDDLLLLARADSGEAVFRNAQVDLQQVVVEAVSLLQPLAVVRSISVTADLQKAEVIGDAERLGQVVCNLLSNAIQYNRDGGTIRLTLDTQDGYACLSISDTGVGICAADHTRVFDRFYRADASRTSSVPGGSGLGLSISREIVSVHGGTIELTSVVETGTTVVVRIPTAFTFHSGGSP